MITLRSGCTILVYFPLCKPSFVECQADVDAESVFRDETSSCRACPLRTNVEHGLHIATGVPCVLQRQPETDTDTQLLGAVVSIVSKPPRSSASARLPVSSISADSIQRDVLFPLPPQNLRSASLKTGFSRMPPYRNMIWKQHNCS